MPLLIPFVTGPEQKIVRIGLYPPNGAPASNLTCRKVRDMQLSMATLETRTLEDLGASRADAAERVRQQHSLSEKGLGALMVANGGALIGLFTFVGNATGKAGSLHFNLPMIWAAFWLFCVGIGMTLASYLMAFLSQDRFYFQSMHEVERLRRTLAADIVDRDTAKEELANQQGMNFYKCAIICAGIAIVSFMIGCGLALGGVLPA
ncbi:hypothetical protein [Sphingobium lactosutens]|uniref:hypothetical protein n=1 Tax=Sphingobium lactosutens TaxID=522773 RepID=UPI0015BF44F7|nr:hypothetical protein [Sphingobium lactosutens]